VDRVAGGGETLAVEPPTTPEPMMTTSDTVVFPPELFGRSLPA